MKDGGQKGQKQRHHPKHFCSMMQKRQKGQGKNERPNTGEREGKRNYRNIERTGSERADKRGEKQDMKSRRTEGRKIRKIADKRSAERLMSHNRRQHDRE